MFVNVRRSLAAVVGKHDISHVTKQVPVPVFLVPVFLSPSIISMFWYRGTTR